MAVIVEEHFDGSEATIGATPYVSLRYDIHGTDDFDEAHLALLDTAPVTYDLYGLGLVHYPRQSVRCVRVSDQQYEGVVTYGAAASAASGGGPLAGEISFETGGGTQRVFQSLATVRYAPPDKTAPDYKGAVAVVNGNIEGVEIVVPVFRFSETFYLDDSFVTPAYRDVLFALTGKVNSDLFKGFAAGECLFMGASGRRRALGDWALTYNFACQINATGLVVGEIENIVKRGWDYLWVLHEDHITLDTKDLVKRPKAVYVEQVYPYADLNLLGI